MQGKEQRGVRVTAQASSDVLLCREHGMNPSKLSTWYCLPMKGASGVIWPAATDQREARVCKEEEEEDKHCH